MKKILKPSLFITAIIAVFMFSITALASTECPTCHRYFNGNYEHTDDHTLVGYSPKPNDSNNHMLFCLDCLANGHVEKCCYIPGTEEKHTYEKDEETGKILCSKCKFEKPEECAHENSIWRESEYGDELEKPSCVHYCYDCQQIVETKAHSYGKIVDSNDSYHTKTCTRCGNYINEDHKYKKVYTVEKAAKSYKTNCTKRGRDHNVKLVCTCGHKGYLAVSNEKHTFKNNKCKYCGYKRVIGAKAAIKSVKGKYTGAKTVKTSARWFWNSREWIYYPAGSYTLYNYSFNVSWKKAKGAKAYVITTQKIKAGDVYVNNAVIYQTAKASKTSTVYTLASKSKVSSITVYVAQVNKDGIIGKVSKKKIKL